MWLRYHKRQQRRINATNPHLAALVDAHRRDFAVAKHELNSKKGLGLAKEIIKHPFQAHEALETARQLTARANADGGLTNRGGGDTARSARCMGAAAADRAMDGRQTDGRATGGSGETSQPSLREASRVRGTGGVSAGRAGVSAERMALEERVDQLKRHNEKLEELRRAEIEKHHQADAENSRQPTRRHDRDGNGHRAETRHATRADPGGRTEPGGSSTERSRRDGERRVDFAAANSPPPRPLPPPEIVARRPAAPTEEQTARVVMHAGGGKAPQPTSPPVLEARRPAAAVATAALVATRPAAKPVQAKVVAATTAAMKSAQPVVARPAHRPAAAAAYAPTSPHECSA